MIFTILSYTFWGCFFKKFFQTRKETKILITTSPELEQCTIIKRRNFPPAYLLLCMEFPPKNQFMEANKSKKIKNIKALSDSKYLEYFLQKDGRISTPWRGDRCFGLLAQWL
jgi:hypothetical protein